VRARRLMERALFVAVVLLVAAGIVFYSVVGLMHL
jgi:hypothetical protein